MKSPLLMVLIPLLSIAVLAGDAAHDAASKAGRSREAIESLYGGPLRVSAITTRAVSRTNIEAAVVSSDLRVEDWSQDEHTDRYTTAHVLLGTQDRDPRKRVLVSLFVGKSSADDAMEGLCRRLDSRPSVVLGSSLSKLTNGPGSHCFCRHTRPKGKDGEQVISAMWFLRDNVAVELVGRGATDVQALAHAIDGVLLASSPTSSTPHRQNANAEERQECARVRRSLESAKEHFALSKKLGLGDSVTLTDIVSKAGQESKTWSCPAGGQLVIGPVGEPVRCSIHGE